MHRKLAISSLSGLAVPLAAAVSAFVATPVLLRSLGQEDYGLWILCASVAGYASLLDLGMAGAATRFLAGALGEADAPRLASLFLAFRRFYRAMGAGLIALGLLLAAASRLASEDGAWATGLFVVGILVAAAGLGFLFRVSAVLLRANLEYQAIAFAGVLRTAVYTVVVLLAAPRLGLVELAWLFAALTLGEQVLVWAQARRLAPRRRELEGIDAADFRPIFGHAGKTVLAAAAAALRWRADTQIIGGAVSLHAVTQYSVGLKVPQLFFDLIYTLFGSQFVAAFAQWRRRHPEEDPRPMLGLAMKACAIVSYTGACVLFFVIPPFLERWLGPGYDVAKELARILLPCWALRVLPVPLNLFLTAESRHGRTALLSAAGAVANLALSLLLVLPFGAKGVVIATACEMFALVVAYAFWVAPAVGWRALDFLWHLVALPYLRFALLAVPVCHLLGGRLLAADYPSLVLGGLALGSSALLVAVFTIPDRNERKMLLALARKGFG